MKVQSATFVKGIRGSDKVAEEGKPMVAFVGRSNVGKSSLINALTNRTDLVKVSGTPGKTLEVNFFLINDNAYFVDLPGYGYARVSPEEKQKLQKLIVWFLTTDEFKASTVVLVVDSKVGLTKFDMEMLEILREQNHHFVIAANKIDKLSNNEAKLQMETIGKESGGAQVVAVSAEKKTGLKDLLQQLD
jgi:GTP-binding protein